MPHPSNRRTLLIAGVASTLVAALGASLRAPDRHAEAHDYPRGRPLSNQTRPNPQNENAVIFRYETCRSPEALIARARRTLLPLGWQEIPRPTGPLALPSSPPRSARRSLYARVS